MTILDVSRPGTDADAPAVDRPRKGSTAGTGWAKAYCGPAHGHTWRRVENGSWPARVVLPGRTGPMEYRLVHDIRAHRPARDHLGNTLYMPVPPRHDWGGWTVTE